MCTSCILISFIFISFSSPAFPSEIIAYRPPHAVRNTSIHKVTSCDSTFAALSTNGEVFTFSFPSPGESTNREGINVLVKPQRVWALRKQFSAVKVRTGDDTLLTNTLSHHVFRTSSLVLMAQLSSAPNQATFLSDHGTSDPPLIRPLLYWGSQILGFQSRLSSSTGSLSFSVL